MYVRVSASFKAHQERQKLMVGTLSHLSTWSQVSTGEHTLDTSTLKAQEMHAETVSPGHTFSRFLGDSKMAMDNGGARPK